MAKIGKDKKELKNASFHFFSLYPLAEAMLKAQGETSNAPTLKEICAVLNITTAEYEQISSRLTALLPPPT